MHRASGAGEILNNPGKLTAVERMVIEQHPVTAYGCAAGHGRTAGTTTIRLADGRLDFLYEPHDSK